MKKIIEAIIFDLDGMVYHEPDRFSNYYANKFGVPAGDLLNFFVDEYAECQTGELDIKEVLPDHFAKWQWNSSVDDLLDLWANFGDIDEEMIDLVSQLRGQGIVCVLATNNEKYRFEKMNEKYGFDKLFDYLFNSYKIGDLKPGKTFCDQMVSALGLKPDEILVCDDKPKSIEALKLYGFKTYFYQDIDKFIKDIRSFGISL